MQDQVLKRKLFAFKLFFWELYSCPNVWACSWRCLNLNRLPASSSPRPAEKAAAFDEANRSPQQARLLPSSVHYGCCTVGRWILRNDDERGSQSLRSITFPDPPLKSLANMFPTNPNLLFQDHPSIESIWCTPPPFAWNVCVGSTCSCLWRNAPFLR